LELAATDVDDTRGSYLSALQGNGIQLSPIPRKPPKAATAYATWPLYLSIIK
jgi:hypothetical protein